MNQKRGEEENAEEEERSGAKGERRKGNSMIVFAPNGVSSKTKATWER